MVVRERTPHPLVPRGEASAYSRGDLDLYKKWDMNVDERGGLGTHPEGASDFRPCDNAVFAPPGCLLLQACKKLQIREKSEFRSTPVASVNRASSQIPQYT